MIERSMTRRGFLRRSAAAAGAAAIAPAGARLLAAAAAEVRKPNILLIMADDLGYECLGCNGGTSYKTPNLDHLAATGMRFEHCYCTPLCSPTRIEIMTGRYGFRNYKGWGVLDPKERTFGHVLRAAGYATAVSGKWQLCHFHRPENADHPKRAGFDRFCVWTWHYKGKKPSRYWDPFIWQDGKLRGDLAGKYGPDVHRDYVIDFIERNRSRPFLAYYPVNLVHGPFVPTPDSKAARGGKGAGAGGKGRRQRGAARQANYAAMVAYLDKCVGRVVGALDRLGLRDKTLILFTGDNGTPRGITSKMGKLVVPGGKGRMTDTGTHVPLIANWKGRVPAGKVCSDLVDFSDVLPTLADAARAKLPEGVTIDGRSFLPQLTGKPGRPREWVYIHHGTAAADGAHRAVRTKRWKLYGNGRLYDVTADPFEKTPLKAGAESAEAAAARKKLRAVLAKLK